MWKPADRPSRVFSRKQQQFPLISHHPSVNTLASVLPVRLPCPPVSFLWRSPRLLSLAVSEAGTDHVVSFVFMSSELTGKELSEESETPCARSEVARQAVPAETLAGAAIPSPPPCLGDIRVVAVTDRENRTTRGWQVRAPRSRALRGAPWAAGFLCIRFLVNFLAVLGLRRCADFSPIAASGARGLLLAVAPLVAEQGLQGLRASVVWARGLVVLAHGLSCSAARGISPDRGSNLCLWHWQAGTSH